MKNKITDLNNHLFEQLERLNDDELKGDDLEREIRRADAMCQVSEQLIRSANVSLNAARLVGEYGVDVKRGLPLLDTPAVSLVKVG